MEAVESLHTEAVLKALETHHDRLARPVRMFHQRDKVSQAWLSALPSPLSLIPSPEFTEAMAWHLFLPSPACAPHVGSMVKRKPMDPFGEVLMCATLPFDSWRLRHDRIKLELQSIALDSGANVDTEPYSLFSHLIPFNISYNKSHQHK